MSKKRHKIFKCKHLLLILATMLIGITGVSVLSGCSWSRHQDIESDNSEQMSNLDLRDPLPGELVQQTLMEDSVRSVRREQIRVSMTKIITDYRKRFRQEHFTGYFLTDLDHDGLPELWVKVGNYRDNSKLELFYPMPDGTLLKSDTFAEPGQYYIGDNYIIQVVGGGAGYININRISLHNGVMDVENVRGIDLYADPQASIPTFAEREIRDTSFNNLSTLNQALL